MIIFRKLLYVLNGYFKRTLERFFPRSKEQQAADFFTRLFKDKTVEEVDAVVHELWRDYRHWDKLSRIVRPNENDDSITVCDVGGGLTSVTRLLATSKKWVVDMCASEIERRNLPVKPGVNLICGRAEALPFPDDFFDYVFCTNAIDHFESPILSLKEMERTLKNTGYCIITVDIFENERGYRNLLHPNSFTEQGAMDLFSQVFDIVEVLRATERGKVGFGQLV